jgi:hypothetical protein
MLGRTPRAEPQTALCPRCRGRLATERDRFGVYETCFMCGYARDCHAAPSVLPSDEGKADALS